MRLVRLAVLAALLALAAGCGGDGETAPPERPLDDTTFKRVVVSEIHGGELTAEGMFGPQVKVHKGGNWVVLDLEEPYAAYRKEPERRDEIVRGLKADAEKRFAEGLDERSLEAVRPDLMPLLKPTFALRRLEDTPVGRPFLKNLRVVYAVESESDFFYVTEADLERWGTTVEDVDPIAMRNLARRTEPLLCEEQLCGWANGDGYDATRMLVPKLRREIEREIGPAAYAVPMEHVFVAVPIKFAGRIGDRVLHDFTTAKNPVSPDVFVERGGRLVPLPS